LDKFCADWKPKFGREGNIAGLDQRVSVGEGDGNIFVIGGGQKGMSGDDGEHNTAIKKENLVRGVGF
jgi:hypothetical protein